MPNEIVEIFNTTPQVSWLPWAIQYSFLIALSYGGFFLSLPGLVMKKEGWRSFSRTALIIALGTGICAPLALLADLHQPARFVNFFLHFQPGSWMSWGAFFLPAYTLALLLYARQTLAPELDSTAKGQGFMAAAARILGPKDQPSPAFIRMGTGLCVLMAVLIVIYTGAEMMVVTARPLWNSLFMPVALTLSGLAAAGTLALSFTAFARDCQGNALPLRTITMIQAVLLAALGLWWLAGASALSPALGRAYAELQDFAFLQSMTLCFSSQLVLGFGLSLLLQLRGSRCPWAIATLAFLNLGSAFAMRWMLFIGAQQIARMGAGHSTYSLPLGYDGLWGMLGTTGLLIGLLILLTELFSGTNPAGQSCPNPKGAHHEI